MRNGYSSSLFFMFAGIGVGLTLLFLFSKQKVKVRASLASGLAVAFANFWGAYLAHKMDWWHESGAWMVLNVPLSMNIGWIFLGAGYCLLYSLTDKMPHPKLAKILTVIFTSCYGVLNDSLIMRFGILRLGTGMKIYNTFPYWLVLITGTLLLFEYLSKNEK